MIIYGHRHQGGYEIPDWAGTLRDYYWMIRVQGRDKAKRRRYYRYAAKEKLRLAEQGIDQNLIRFVCRYLACFHPNDGKNMQQIMITSPIQLILDFN